MDERYGQNRKDDIEHTIFEPMWPAETSGDGRLVANNRNTGAGQGIASFVSKAKCKQCGYPVDLSQNDHTGGSLDGNGAGGGISVATYTATYPNGTTHTEYAGTQTYNKGAGCPLCFSKNSADSPLDLQQDVRPFDSLPLAGF